MSALLITDLVGSVIVIAGFLIGLFKLLPRLVRWAGSVVEAARHFVTFIGENTAATDRLTGVVTEVRDDIKQVVATLGDHGRQLADHGDRIARSEDLIGDLGIRVTKIEEQQDGTVP